MPEVVIVIVRKDLGGPGLPYPWPRLPRHAWSRYGYVDDSCRVCSASCSVLGSSKLGKTGASALAWPLAGGRCRRGALKSRGRLGGAGGSVQQSTLDESRGRGAAGQVLRSDDWQYWLSLPGSVDGSHCSALCPPNRLVVSCLFEVWTVFTKEQVSSAPVSFCPTPVCGGVP